MTVALLTAAGTGSRMGQDIPKQFLHVENRPIIIYTMEVFQQHPGVDAILVVTLPAWMDVLKAYAKQFGITKLCWVIPGGETGQESIYNGLSYELTEAEKASTVFRRSIFAVKDIEKGDVFTEENTKVIRPSYGLAPKNYKGLLGKEADRSYVSASDKM